MASSSPKASPEATKVQDPPPYPHSFDDAGGSSSGSDEEPEGTNADALNISIESDHLDPAQRAAHEADTLPMDGVGVVTQKELAKEEKKKQKLINVKKLEEYLSPVLTSHNELPPSPTSKDKCLHSFRCPPHGSVGRALTLALIPLILWLTCLSMFGSVAAPPHGTLFILIVLVVFAIGAGQCFALVKLPPLLGMLLMGIIIKNLPGLEFQDNWNTWSSTLRGTALVIILMRAGLGLDPIALKRLSGMVFRLAFTPCLVETTVVAICSNLLLGFPWLWGFMLGFVLSAVSPAVVVPCLLQLQEKGYGVAKGIPTLVIAAASVDDVLAISGFTILLGITFNPGQSLSSLILQGPLEAIVGLAVGSLWGLVVVFLPSKDDKQFNALRFLFLFGGGLLALFGSKKIGFAGAGALAVLVMAFVAGVGWRRRGWADDADNVVAKYLGQMWIIFQPILFGLIGTEIKISSLDPNTIGLGLLVLVIGLSIRVVVSFFSVMGGDLTLKERLFVALAWLPKATVQAAIGPVAYDTANQMANPDPQLQALGLQVLTIAVLVILITAPIGAIAIMLSAPKLLTREERSNDVEKSQ